MGIFYREKAFKAGEKIRKNDFAPSEKYACYAPGYKLYYTNILWLLTLSSLQNCTFSAQSKNVNQPIYTSLFTVVLPDIFSHQSIAQSNIAFIKPLVLFSNSSPPYF